MWYSNLSHTLAYSLVGLQNMNLAYNYPIIFWNTANLIVDSAGIEEESNVDQDEFIENIEDAEAEVEIEDDDDDEEEVVKKEKVKRVKKTIDYGKIAKAIGRFRSYGINILPPNINTSGFTFTPNVEQNSITYGLRGITRISNDIIHTIIANRPYTSFEDFSTKVKLNKLQTINLIKSGAFDEISDSRENLMKNYLSSISDQKQRLTLQNMQMLINKELIPDEMSFYAKLFLFNKFLKTQKHDLYYILNESAINFISNNFSADIIDNGVQILQTTWDTLYKKTMMIMGDYIKAHKTELLTALNNILINETIQKYGLGNISKWEMDSISFYYHNHELESVAADYTDFFSLNEEPEVEYSFQNNNGQEIKVFKLYQIVGTVIDKNKLKNTVTLLTPNGVVPVKIYKNQYSIYDKQISERDSEGKKHVVEKSWFTKGTMLMVQGIRRGSDFIPKKRKNSVFPIISKITGINENNKLIFQFERKEVDE